MTLGQMPSSKGRKLNDPITVEQSKARLTKGTGCATMTNSLSEERVFV